MLKSDYIRREHENTLLISGYICVGEKRGIQTWVDMQSSGQDIQHLVYNYPLYVDEFGALTPGEAEQSGAVYFVVQEVKTTWVSQAIGHSRTP